MTLPRYMKHEARSMAFLFPQTKETGRKYIKKRPEFKTGIALQDKYVVKDNACLARKIFSRFLMKVLTRVSQGELFVFPGCTQATITLKKTPDNEVKKLRQMGKFADYDIVAADFQIPRFRLDFGPKSRLRDMGIHVPPRIMSEALKRAENREIEWLYIPKNYGKDI